MFEDYKDYWKTYIKEYIECSDEQFDNYNNEEDIEKIFNYADKQDWFWTGISDLIEMVLYDYKKCNKKNK